MQQAMPVPTPEPGKLTVVDVRARPAPLEGGNGAAFMTVLNGLDKAVRLASIAGDAAAAIELHETVNDNGVMKMEPHPEGFEIPAGRHTGVKARWQARDASGARQAAGGGRQR